MSLADRINQRAHLKHRDYGFILALIGVALALVVAGVVFTPAPVGSGISNDVLVVSP